VEFVVESEMVVAIELIVVEFVGLCRVLDLGNRRGLWFDKRVV
jgi:hypothetical protein